MERFLSCAAIGAHALRPQDGFRQVEMKFVLELNLHWMRATRFGIPLEIHNNQIRRHLHRLCDNGFAHSSGKGQKQTFHLTRAGLLGELRQIYKMPCLPPDHFYFIFYFAKRYKRKVHRLVEASGFDLPKALELDIDSLMNPEHLLYTQLRLVEKEIENLKYQINKVKNAASLSKKMQEQNRPIRDIAQAIEKNYPYDLNALRKLSELYLDLPPDLQIDEMIYGNLDRAHVMWGPQLSQLLHTQKVLKALQAKP